jgi:hypothetical protein
MPKTAIAEAKKELVATSAANEELPGFIDSPELAKRLGVSLGTLGNWRKAGLPFIVTPGRLIRYDWKTVRESFLRRQRGGLA